MITIAVLGTLDTKGPEHAFVAERIRQAGHRPLLIDVGTSGEPTVVPDVSRDEVRRRTVSLGKDSASKDANDRGAAIAEMSKLIPVLLAQLVESGQIQGVISLGGTGGTAIGTAGMRALPLGFPKVMVSTVAGSNVAKYVDVSDIVMFPSIVDVSGLNRISLGVFARAAAAVCAMAEANLHCQLVDQTKPVIVASMFGNTTRCVEHAKGLLEAAGYEVIVFHATGIGGRTMESLIASGMVSGVLDITTTEWADELVGGVMGAGPHRLEAAARCGIPAIVAPGCLDMVNFGERHTIPQKFENRTFYQHNPQITLMRTSADECRQLGRIIAEKLNLSLGPVEFVVPLRAISVISAVDQPFHDPVADQAFLDSLRASLRPDIAIQTLDCEINDAVFAEQCVAKLLAAVASQKSNQQQSR